MNADSKRMYILNKFANRFLLIATTFFYDTRFFDRQSWQRLWFLGAIWRLDAECLLWWMLTYDSIDTITSSYILKLFQFMGHNSCGFIFELLEYMHYCGKRQWYLLFLYFINEWIWRRLLLIIHNNTHLYTYIYMHCITHKMN